MKVKITASTIVEVEELTLEELNENNGESAFEQLTYSLEDGEDGATCKAEPHEDPN